MVTLLDFAIERYNYWIVIILMMTGLYTVITRGNLIKKMIGLNLFQTSVFIFYITIGKIAGGTAPIYLPGDLEKLAGHADAPHEAPHDAASAAEPTKLHDAGAHGAGDAAANRLDSVANARDSASLHQSPGDANAVAALHAAAADDHAAAGAAGEAAHLPDAVIDTIYTNPLPSVLILTAIVVGVATTAVGLALAVRIREAYGSIEEDELLAADDLAEFGAATSPRGSGR